MKVYLSHSRKDLQVVIEITNAIRAEGIDVFNDNKLEAGEIWEEQIKSELEAADLIVVLWSEASASSTYVRDEASYARDHDKLFPVVLDKTKLPMGFQQFSTFSFSAPWGETKQA
ncbi:MAG: toll/interleukin-1 receptor domain-containing protein, partial [Pseudomonadota bacterium]